MTSKNTHFSGLNQFRKVSVIIPTLNRDEILCKTLEYFFIQNYLNFEIIVVDQSDSHSVSVLDFFESHKDRFRYHHISKKGLTLARNTGISLAKGEILLFCDDDVIPPPDFVAAHAANYSDPSIGGVAGKILEPGEKEEYREQVGRITPCGRVVRNFNSTQRGWVEHAQGCNMSFRKNIMLEVGLFDETYSGNALFEETDYCYRIRKLGYKIVFDPKAELMHLVYQEGGCQTRTQTLTDYYYNFIRNKTLFFMRNMNIFFLPCLYYTILGRALITGIFQERKISNFIKLAVHAPLEGFKAFREKYYSDIC